MLKTVMYIPIIVFFLISGVAWISPEYLQERGLNGVNLGDMDENKLIEMVDELITCALPDEEEKSQENCELDLTSDIKCLPVETEHKFHRPGRVTPDTVTGPRT